VARALLCGRRQRLRRFLHLSRRRGDGVHHALHVGLEGVRHAVHGGLLLGFGFRPDALLLGLQALGLDHVLAEGLHRAGHGAGLVALLLARDGERSVAGGELAHQRRQRLQRLHDAARQQHADAEHEDDRDAAGHQHRVTRPVAHRDHRLVGLRGPLLGESEKRVEGRLHVREDLAELLGVLVVRKPQLDEARHVLQIDVHQLPDILPLVFRDIRLGCDLVEPRALLQQRVQILSVVAEQEVLFMPPHRQHRGKQIGTAHRVDLRFDVVHRLAQGALGALVLVEAHFLVRLYDLVELGAVIGDTGQQRVDVPGHGACRRHRLHLLQLCGHFLRRIAILFREGEIVAQQEVLLAAAHVERTQPDDGAFLTDRAEGVGLRLKERHATVGEKIDAKDGREARECKTDQNGHAQADAQIAEPGHDVSPREHSSQLTDRR
jgi:hypothetical protein